MGNVNRIPARFAKFSSGFGIFFLYSHTNKPYLLNSTRFPTFVLLTHLRFAKIAVPDENIQVKAPNKKS